MMSLLRKIARRVYWALYRLVRLVVWIAHFLRRVVRLFFRIIRAILWSLVSWPRSYVPRVRYYFDVIRAGGLLWLIMQAVRRFQLVPFTMIDGLYYRVCREMNLVRADSYSNVVLYGSDGGPSALRNFLIDLDARRRTDPDIRRKRRLEVAIASSRLESDAFFSVAHLFPEVQDVHFYVTREQLFAELPFFLPAPKRHGTVAADWMVELDDYSRSRVMAHFERGRAIDIPLPALASWKATQPFIHALLRSQTIVVLNLPSPDGTYDGMRAMWAEFFASLYETKRPQALMVVGAVQPIAQVEAHPNGITVFYASQLGMDMLDFLALVRQVDGYIGAYDEYGLMTVGTSVPALLMQPDARPPATPIDEPRYRRSATGQIMSLDPLTGRQVFEQYNRLILDRHF